MLFRDRTAVTRLAKFTYGAIAIVIAGSAGSSVAWAEVPFGGPTFRKGLWRFDRTLEYPNHRVVVRQEELTRCVDPTHAMKGTFSSPDIGSCRSTKPERSENRYTFESRCDFMGPVRTDIIVHSDEAYTETNGLLNAGNFPKVDKVIAQRIGDCGLSE